MTNEQSTFNVLNAINVNGHTEKKNGLTYLSWAWAWAEVKKNYPDAQYTIYESRDGWNYFTDGRTCWVKTGVTINGLEHIEYLPVMDHRNASISAERVTSFDVNKAIQRSLTKACARHGLGLYIYAGEDLPEEEAEDKAYKPNTAAKKAKTEKRIQEIADEMSASSEPLPWEEPTMISEETVDGIWSAAEQCEIAEKVVFRLIAKHYQKNTPEELTADEGVDFLNRLSSYRSGGAR